MIVFQDLTLSHPEPDTLIELIERELGEDWKRDRECEERLKRSGSEQFAFCYLGSGLPQANLFLIRKGREFRVTNVVPITTSELSRKEYNALLADFHKQISGIPKLEDTLTKPDKTIEASMSRACAKKLRDFSGLANMSTGRAHPLDEERWLAFILCVAKDKMREPVAPDELRSFLEELGWDEDGAYRLSFDYEYGLDAMKYALGI